MLLLAIADATLHQFRIVVAMQHPYRIAVAMQLLLVVVAMAADSLDACSIVTTPVLLAFHPTVVKSPRQHLFLRAVAMRLQLVVAMQLPLVAADATADAAAPVSPAVV